MKTWIVGLLIPFVLALSLSAAPATHNGTEQVLTHILTAQVLGGAGSRAGITLQGGTPNHRALAAAVAYLYSLKVPGTPDAINGRARALAFLRGQMVAHMTAGKMSEFGTSSHFSWWQEAMGALWLAAFRANDAEVLALARGWWVHELTVENACATPSGHVVMLGARSFVGGVDADQRAQRDKGRAIILGLPFHVAPEVVDFKRAPSADDNAGLWVLLQIPRGELSIVARANPAMPPVLNFMSIQRTAGGVVSWVDRFDGLRPAYWALAVFATGAETYGIDPKAPKGQPGGDRPASLSPVPSPPAGVAKSWRLTPVAGATSP